MNAPHVLARAADLVQPALRKAVGSLDPGLRTPAEYHFGWVDPDGTPISAPSGKGIRPALAVLGAEAAGGSAADAIAGAVALELIHNFSLIHDDIIDGDRTRRHRRTVWDVYGVADAIIVADALHTLAFEVLLAEGDAKHISAARRLAAATAAMIAGQAQDMALDRRADAALSDCLTMEANKTGALLAQSVAIGAVLAGADDDVAGCLERYGADVGVAFQAVDDVLGIWGDPAVTGKPIGSDLREHKKSMPVAMALEAGGVLADELAAAFRGPLTDADIERLTCRFDEHGIRARVRELADQRFAAALGALHQCRLEPIAMAELEAVATFVVEREF